jgi:hypothetical protein
MAGCSSCAGLQRWLRCCGAEHACRGQLRGGVLQARELPSDQLLPLVAACQLLRHSMAGQLGELGAQAVVAGYRCEAGVGLDGGILVLCGTMCCCCLQGQLLRWALWREGWLRAEGLHVRRRRVHVRRAGVLRSCGRRNIQGFTQEHLRAGDAAVGVGPRAAVEVNGLGSCQSRSGHTGAYLTLIAHPRSPGLVCPHPCPPWELFSCWAGVGWDVCSQRQRPPFQSAATGRWAACGAAGQLRRQMHEAWLGRGGAAGPCCWLCAAGQRCGVHAVQVKSGTARSPRRT